MSVTSGRKVSAFLWDADGTIVDSEKVCLRYNE